MATEQSPAVAEFAAARQPAPGRASYQFSTRRARSVFHRLGSLSPSSIAKWTAPGWVFSSNHLPSGCFFDRTMSTASARRGSGSSPAVRKAGREGGARVCPFAPRLSRFAPARVC